MFSRSMLPIWFAHLSKIQTALAKFHAKTNSHKSQRTENCMKWCIEIERSISKRYWCIFKPAHTISKLRCSTVAFSNRYWNHERAQPEIAPQIRLKPPRTMMILEFSTDGKRANGTKTNFQSISLRGRKQRNDAIVRYPNRAPHCKIFEQGLTAQGHSQSYWQIRHSSGLPSI